MRNESGDWLRLRRGTVPVRDSPRRCPSPVTNFEPRTLQGPRYGVELGDQYLHAGLFEMAAAYLYHIVQNHPFIDGNKRAGAMAALVNGTYKTLNQAGSVTFRVQF